jgi:biotin carboxyl carrier protein
MRHVYRHRDRVLSVDVQRSGGDVFAVSIGGEATEAVATAVDAYALRLEYEGRTRLVHVARVGPAVQVAIDGDVYVLTPETPGAVASDAPVLAAPQIVAPMPGKVIQVLVEEGQTVEAGAGILVLEAMKMENRIVAEAAAVVRRVYVAAGEMVEGGAVLLELDYDTNG